MRLITELMQGQNDVSEESDVIKSATIIISAVVVEFISLLFNQRREEIKRETKCEIIR